MTSILLSSSILSLVTLLAVADNINHDADNLIEHHTTQQSASINYTKILEFWKQHKDELIVHTEYKDFVLLMGNTGAGKSTLASALTGKKLSSITVEDNSYRIFTDAENRIGNDSMSKTFIPEVMVDSSNNVSYIDLPGFRDNRNVEHELSAVYFQNIMMDSVERVKIVLVIHYDSLKTSGNKNDFDDLFSHVGTIIGNIPKFYDAIGLVVTKVENIYYFSKNDINGTDDDDDDDGEGEGEGGTHVLINDNQLVLTGIVSYLKRKQEIFRHKTDNIKKHRMLADLIDVLVQTKGSSYPRIAIFRQPTKSGDLEKLPLTNNEINNIASMINENLHYVKRSKDDFCVALSSSSKIIVDKIVDEIFRNALTNNLYKLGNEIVKYYLQLEEQCRDFDVLHNRITEAYNVLLRMKNVNEPLEVFKEFLTAINTLNISVSLDNVNEIYHDIQSLRFFTNLSNDNGDLYILLLKSNLRNIIQSIENLKNIYDFIDNLAENLEEYKSQKLQNDLEIGEIKSSCTGTDSKAVESIVGLGKVSTQIGSSEQFEKIKTLKFTQFQLQHIHAFFDYFSRKTQISCKPEELTARGYNVKIRDVINHDCWSQARVIRVFAVNKVFIDHSIDKIGVTAQIFILAPIWEVLGGPQIILDGVAGEAHKKASARSAISSLENGANGLPGLPGKPAGHFFGVGKKFINSKYLVIHANGGQGGPGQRGGDGFNEIVAQNTTVPTDVPKNEISTAIVPKRLSTNGGNGGAGGYGGYGGTVMVISLGDSPYINISNHQGSIGPGGQGGLAGKATSDGNTELLDVDSIVTNDQHGDKVPSNRNFYERNGKPGYNKDGQILPTKFYMINPYFAVNSLRDDLREYLFKNPRESYLKSFMNDLENVDYLKTQYNTLVLIKEFEGLENQFLKLRNQIDFIPFYNSFLTRIEQFSVAENVLKNKKVLGYLYTAGLTKLFTLKKKRKGRIVVDLRKYLGTIEDSINRIEETMHLQIVEKYQNEYHDTLMKKIHAANDLITNKIEPEIDKLWDQFENQTKAILVEIENNRNEARDTIEKLKEEKEKMRKVMQLRLILGIVKISATLLSFAGPIGAAVGATIIGATSIAEGIAIGSPSGVMPSIPFVNISSTVTARVTDIIDNKPKKLANKLEDVLTNLKQSNNELLLTQEEKIEISTKISELENEIRIVKNTKPQSLSEACKMRNHVDMIKERIRQLTSKQETILSNEAKKLNDIRTGSDSKEQTQREIKYRKSLDYIKKAYTVMQTVQVTYDVFRQYSNDQRMIEDTDDQINVQNQRLRELDKMEDQVYDIVVPDLLQIEQTVNVIKSSLNGSSHAQLDLTKWAVRNTLKDVKSLLQKFTNKMSYELRNDLERFMDKIDEGFAILIDVYDRIDAYADSVKQAKYIAHIESPVTKTIQVTDEELKKAMLELQLMIYSNILTEKYEIASHAFKQHYFPFVAADLQRYELPTNLQLNNTEGLRDNIINRIADMKNYIDTYDATIDHHSDIVHEENLFHSNNSYSSPFYVWKHQTIENEIQQLFNGSEILVKADVFKGVDYNSVKYTDIGINFNLENKTLQNNLIAELENFSLTMRTIGNNYYRCGERYYYISVDDDITISYTLHQDESKNWINPNRVYTLIRRSHAFLSPYGMWSIKLKKINKSASWDQLNIFANETIDLELVGHGYYIEQDPDFEANSCDEHLEEFYDAEDIVKQHV